MSRAAFHRIVRMRVALQMKRRIPSPDEPRVEAPQWALDRAGEVAQSIVSGIRAEGVRVVGDLDSLTRVPTSGRGNEPLPDLDIPRDVAASVAMGAFVAAGLVPDGTVTAEEARHAEIEAMPAVELTSRRLAWIVGRRALDRVGVRGRRGG